MAENAISKVIGSAPVNRVAARVMGSGQHWNPSICNGEDVYDTPPPMAPIGKRVEQPQFTDHTGAKLGRLTILGLLDYDTEGAGGTKWVARCDCGNYVTRTNKAIKRNADPVACCARCVAKRKIRGILHEDEVRRACAQPK